jgi:hypothetical protein
VTTPEISRKQTWCKLAVLIAEGLPDPKEIDFHADGSSIYIQLNTAEAVAAWAERLALRVNTPILADDTWIHGASSVANRDGWHGWYVSLTAYTPADAEPEPVAEDMTAVASIAEGAQS